MSPESFSLRYANALEQYLKSTEHIVFIVVDRQLNIVEHNTAFSRIINYRTSLIGKSILDFLMNESRARQSFTDSCSERMHRLFFVSPDGSSFSLDCTIYPVENTFLLLGGHIMLGKDEIIERMTTMSNELINMTRQLHHKTRALEEAQSQIRVLGGIIPICMYCKEIRNDKGYWNQLEEYITEHSEALFSHGICPKCARIHSSDDED